MRNFIAIIFIVILVFAGILFVTNRKSTPQTAVDGSTDVENVSAADSTPIDNGLLLGDARNSKGSTNPKVTIVEFSDFQAVRDSEIAEMSGLGIEPGNSVIRGYPQQSLTVFENAITGIIAKTFCSCICFSLIIVHI